MLDTQEDLKKIFQKMESIQLRYEMLFKSYIGNESIPDDIKHETLTKLIIRYNKQVSQLIKRIETLSNVRSDAI